VEARLEAPVDEVTRLRSCLNDLVSTMALPALWAGGEPARIINISLDALLQMLRLTVVFVRVNEPESGSFTEMVRLAESLEGTTRGREINEAIRSSLGDAADLRRPARLSIGDLDLCIACARLGLDGEIGIIIAGSQRSNFPVQTERLVLDVAANQAAIGLQQARLLRQQKQVTKELDERVARRTSELATANELLKQEVVERRRAEEAVRERERESRLIVDSIPGLVALLTATGGVEVVNRNLTEYLGQTLEQLSQWGTNETVHPEDLPHVIDVFSRSLASGTPYEIIQRFKRRDGVYRWFANRGFPVRDAKGHVVRWCVLLTDIEERKRAEDALRASERFLLEVQRLSHTGGWRFDVATGIVESSPEIQRVYAPQPDEDISTPPFWFDRIHPDDRPRVQAEFERCMRDKTGYQAEYRIILRDGSIRYQHATGHPILNDAGDLVEFIGASMDMTEYWQATNELGRASEALRELQMEMSRAAQVAIVGELAASIAHEVNQPLSGIITNASTCLRMLGADPPNVDGARETARRTLRDGSRASDVIARLRALFSRKEFTLESMDLNEATREVIALSSSDLQRNRVHLQSELADDLPTITGDRIQLQQVILNLLRNASDAMANIHDRVRRLLVKTEREGEDRVRVTVRDTGTGMDGQSINKLFDAFYTTKSEGMGIGLSVSRYIIESHHGRLWASPNDGPGATFAFSIPCGPAQPAALLDGDGIGLSPRDDVPVLRIPDGTGHR
jgi:PAS domain S-box-containing protein